MTNPDRGDPEAEVWKAVASLEKKAYTRREMWSALTDVAASVYPDDN